MHFALVGSGEAGRWKLADLWNNGRARWLRHGKRLRLLPSGFCVGGALAVEQRVSTGPVGPCCVNRK